MVDWLLSKVYNFDMYNLTDSHKALVKWLVQKVRSRRIGEEFVIFWLYDPSKTTLNGMLFNYDDKALEEAPEITMGALDALAANNLILYKATSGTGKPGSSHDRNWRCTLQGRAYEAVDKDFNAPDTSFIKYLTSLGDVNGFDQELKQRCLPVLGAGASDPMLWDSAVRTAGVILEERLRDIGSISDPNRTGRDLVNDVFGKSGSLASKFNVPSEREGYRDLYAGIVGAFRNPIAHRLIDPSPEDGGAFIVFVNLLLKKLEILR